MKTEYNINDIRLMSLIPTSLKRNLRKGDKIFIDKQLINEVESLLHRDNVNFSVFEHAFNITMIIIH